MKVTANAQRSGDWWAIEVPEVPGVFTQARRLDQVAAMVRDAVALMEDVPESDIEVDIVPVLDDQVAAMLAEAKAARAEAQVLSDKAAAGVRATARALVRADLSFRDIGAVLGVSHQRVAQLLDSVGPRTPKEHGEAYLLADRRAAKTQEAAVAAARSALSGKSTNRAAAARALETVRPSVTKGKGPKKG